MIDKIPEIETDIYYSHEPKECINHLSHCPGIMEVLRETLHNAVQVLVQLNSGDKAGTRTQKKSDEEFGMQTLSFLLFCDPGSITVRVCLYYELILPDTRISYL